MSFPKSRSGKIVNIRTRSTRSGFLLMLVIIAMLVASINYGNNMAYILTFLLFGLMLVGLLNTRRNLKDLDITNLMPEPTFAGEMLRINLELQNRSKGRRFGIWLSYTESDSPSNLSGPFDVEPRSNTTAEISFPATKRGYFTLSYIDLITIYPLGLFLVRGKLQVGKNYLVYPHPKGTRPWPEPEVHSQESGEGYHLKGGDDFTGHRFYRQGESMHHIDWKVVARGGGLCIKEFTGGGSAQLCFSWEHLEGLGIENRLSQLCKWVLEADEQGTEFALKLPDGKISQNSSSTHTLKCLEKLALFQFRS